MKNEVVQQNLHLGDILNGNLEGDEIVNYIVQVKVYFLGGKKKIFP